MHDSSALSGQSRTNTPENVARPTRDSSRPCSLSSSSPLVSPANPATPYLISTTRTDLTMHDSSALAGPSRISVPENVARSGIDSSHSCVVDSAKLDLVLLNIAELQQQIEEHVIKLSDYETMDMDDFGFPLDLEEDVRSLEEKLADKALRSRLVCISVILQ
jgi:hypothetical protein